MQLGIRLEGVVKCDEEWRLTDVLQHLPLRPCVFSSFCLLYNCGFLQNLHGVQLPRIMTAHFPHQEHLAVRWKVKINRDREQSSAQSPKGINRNYSYDALINPKTHNNRMSDWLI